MQVSTCGARVVANRAADRAANGVVRNKRVSSALFSGMIGVLFGLALPAQLPVNAQVSTNRLEGLRDQTPRWHALTGARIVVAPGKVIERGTLVMRDGRIVAVGADVAVPSGARVWKLDGRTVYAGFIDLASSVGVPASMRPAPVGMPRGARGAIAIETTPPPVVVATRGALAAQNRSVRADLDVAAQLDVKADDVKAAREAGFTTVLAAPAVGVFRGQSALVSLQDGADAKAMVMQSRVAQHVANEAERGFGRSVGYPNSTMGAIALVRQTLYDARWYAAAQGKATSERVEANAALDALAAVVGSKQLVIYAAESEQDYQRVAKVRDEFNLRVVLQGNGYEYRRAAQLKSLGMPVIVPLNYPAPPEIENPDSAIDVSLDALQHWEQAPSNLSHLARAGVEFAVTTAGLRDMKEFLPQLRQAVKRGLSADQALAALTTTPAKLIGATNVGTLEAGKLANVVVATNDLFAADTAEIEISFVDGKPHTTPAFDRFDARGTWSVTSGGKTVEWKIGGTRPRPTLSQDSGVCDVAVRGRQLVINFPCRKPAPPNGAAPAESSAERHTVIADYASEALRGNLQSATGVSSVWSASRTTAFIETPTPAQQRASIEVQPAPLSNAYPAGAYGITPPARPSVLLVRNATLWTGGKAGRLERADMLVRDGKIAAIGANLVAPAEATTIDATGKHVSAGIIDAHSHTAIIGSVNESTSSITAEVRVGDVLDATDINIYRQLAGGVTAANLLHGSANTIGGQNQVIKFRWGMDAEGLKFTDAKPGIKFALGENVKQANWGTDAGDRYPQTRMGVEQILRDGFQTARHYQKTWTEHRANPKTVAEPRRDLQLDALAEILDKKRVVHIHAYRADEILMFVRIAQEFGFTVATFQHVLEGYKVADAMASIGAGGSTFSDWWAYKMEVYDAIPNNAALMHKAGVLTTLNSDSNELARRLNTEAAKTVRYGGMSETDALNFVTLNAAKQLRIDDRVGSLEIGKDADFVIWNASPLSSFVKAEQTWIEGRKYFDLATDAALNAQASAERQRLLDKALPARMARLNTMNAARAAGATASGSDTPSSVPPNVRDTLEYMALQRWLHEAKQFRHSYWDGGSWHECTEDAK